MRSLSALNEKVTLLRLLGRLDEAEVIGSEAVRQARFTGDREQVVSSRIRRAQVQQYQGKLDEAAIELGHCIDEAETHEWSAVAGYARQQRGTVHLELDDLDAALTDFKAAVFLRQAAGASPVELENSLIAVTIVESALAARGPVV